MSAGSCQDWNAAGYDKNARFVSELAGEIFKWLAPRGGERILDLGCGDGALTEEIVKAGAVVVGADTSEDLLRAARLRGLDARLIDGQELTFQSEFDAVFSNAALHWMTKPEEVLAGVARALRPGGRFIAEFGGHGNVAAIVTALRATALTFEGEPALANPWFFPTLAEYILLLESAGFECERAELVPRPTALPTGMEGWITTFRKPFFDQFDEGLRKAVLDYVLNLLRPSLCDRSGRWTADYVRLRIAARLKAS